MFLPSSHRVQLEVHCDDDRWSHLESTRSRQRLQRHLLLLSFVTLPRFSTEICAPFCLFVPQSGFPEFVVSSWQFCCTICFWEYDFISLLWRWFFEDKFLMRPTFPNLPDPQSECLLSKSPRRSIHTQGSHQVVLPCQIDEVLIDLALKSDDFRQLLQEELPLNGSPNRLSYGVFPSGRRSWTFRR